VKISNEFKIGLMAIIVIALSVWGYKFLKGRNLLKASNNYYVRYENISGLPNSAAILIRGMNVGTVADIELDADMQSIIATLDVKKGIQIPKDAEAVIISTGLMGGKAVDLVFDQPCSGTDCAKPGSFLKGRVQGFFDSFLDPGPEGTLAKVKETIGDILKTAGDSLSSPTADNEFAKTFSQLSLLMKNLASITGTFNNSVGAYDKHLKGSLSNLETVTGALANNQQKISDIIGNLESITRQFNEANVGTNAGTLITDAQVTMKSLNATIAEANTAFADLATIMNELDEGKGTLGKLLNDEALYDNLNSASVDLDLLLQDFRLNPKRYVNVSLIGKKQKEYTVPEDDPAKQ